MASSTYMSFLDHVAADVTPEISSMRSWSPAH